MLLNFESISFAPFMPATLFQCAWTEAIRYHNALAKATSLQQAHQEHTAKRIRCRKDAYAIAAVDRICNHNNVVATSKLVFCQPADVARICQAEEIHRV